jgi:hypothetical protein
MSLGFALLWLMERLIGGDNESVGSVRHIAEVVGAFGILMAFILSIVSSLLDFSRMCFGRFDDRRTLETEQDGQK